MVRTIVSNNNKQAVLYCTVVAECFVCVHELLIIINSELLIVREEGIAMHQKNKPACRYYIIVLEERKSITTIKHH